VISEQASPPVAILGSILESVSSFKLGQSEKSDKPRLKGPRQIKSS
jgi:hypothetical protein